MVVLVLIIIKDSYYRAHIDRVIAHRPVRVLVFVIIPAIAGHQIVCVGTGTSPLGVPCAHWFSLF